MADFDEWGDDPFEGDISFDDDFDSEDNRGFLRSLATGFLNGLVSNSIGDSNARMNTARTILPKSFADTFDRVRELNDTRKMLVDEFKEKNAQTVDDLQYLARRANEGLKDYLPNKISSGLERFSEKDFSHWDSGGYSDNGSSDLNLDVTDDDLARLNDTMSAQSGLLVGISGTLSKVIAGVGGRQAAGIETMTGLMMQNNSALNTLVDYQRKIQSRNDALKINILSRMHITNAKYYKFMEAAMHRNIRELKSIVKNTAMSEYEKTSMSQAMRSNFRDKALDVVTKKVGGIAGFITERFDKSEREDAYERFGSSVGSIRMAAEMAEGMPLNYGEMMGDMIAGQVLDRLPYFFKYGKGKDYVDRVSKKFPDQAKRLKEAYKKLEDVGNITSYMANNAGSLVNAQIRNFGNADMEDEQTYEEYVASLPPNQKPMNKAVWNTAKAAKSVVNAKANDMFSSMSTSQGTSNILNKRTLQSLSAPALWTSLESRTLTEVIPGWFAKVHLSLEKMRTGNNDLQAETYNFGNGKFLSKKANQKQIENTLFRGGEFRSFASSANSIVDSIDKDGTLSKSAKSALALRIARDADRDEFDPYSYYDMEGVSPAEQKEINAILQSSFGIDKESVENVNTGTITEQLMRRAKMPTAAGRELANSVSGNVKYLKRWMPDFSKNISLLRGTGGEEVLREMGLINTVNGQDKWNDEAVWEQLKHYIEGNDPSKMTVGGEKPGPTENRNPYRPVGDSDATSDFNDMLTESINNLSAKMEGFGRLDSANVNVELDPLLTKVDDVNEKLLRIIDLNEAGNTLLDKILAKAPGLAPKGTPEAKEEAEAEKQKQSLFDRIKSAMPGNLLSGAMDKLAKHEPLILGSMLGGLAGLAINNPKAAGLMALGAAGFAGWNKLANMANSNEPSDDEDIYDGEDPDPILTASKLRRGMYYDEVLKRVISSWREIKGGITDVVTKAYVSAKKLSGKIFSKEGKEFVLKGLSWVKDTVSKIYKAIDPVGKFNTLKDKMMNKFYTQDVYKAGETEPTLYGVQFGKGKYFKVKDGVMTELKGWNEIDGVVYDDEQHILITEKDYENGLKTAAGFQISKFANFSKSVGKGFMSLLGQAKDKALEKTKGIRGKVDAALHADYSPIVNSVDRIYALLCKHWGYAPTAETPSLAEALGEVMGGSTPGGGSVGKDGIRVNSAEDKERIRKEEKSEEVQNSIIDIAEAMNAGEDKPGEQGDKKKGLFGNIMGGIFNFIKNPLGWLASMSGTAAMSGIGLLGKFLTIGIKTLPAIASGIVGLGSIIARSLMGLKAGNITDLADAASGGKVKKGRGRLARGLGKIGFGRSLGLGLAASYGMDAVGDMMGVEEGSTTDQVMDATSTGLGIASGVGMANSALVAMGVSGGLATVGSGLLTAAGAVGSVLFSPIGLGVAAVVGGIALYKYYNKGKGKQYELRLAQYGINDPDSDFADTLRGIEAKLENYAVVSGGKGSFNNDAPMEEIFAPLMAKCADEKQKEGMIFWFNARFKPVFLTYMATLEVGNYTSLKTYDEATDPNVLQIAKAVHASVSSFTPPPYSVSPVLSNEIGIMDRDQTIAKVNVLLDELTTYNKRRGKDENGFNTDLEGTKIQTTSEVTEQVKSYADDDTVFGKGDNPNFISRWFQSREADELSKKFPVDIKIQNIDVSDVMPGEGKELDLLTAIRLACYGNAENIPWRVEAVLKLERVVENQISVIANDVRFTGKTGDLFNEFKDLFRITSKDADAWCTWFRDRFLPVLMIYVKGCYNSRRGTPKDVWRSLSDTIRNQIALDMEGCKVVIDEDSVSIWSVRASPFEGTISYFRTAKMTKMLENMAAAATQARLKDPELEARKSSPLELVKFNEVHAPGQGAANNRANEGGNGPGYTFGGNPASATTYEAFGKDFVSQSGATAPGMNAMAGSTDTSMVDLSGVRVNPGDDSGVSVPMNVAEQMLIKEMMAAGFTDPRQIAEMLALCRYETGDFKRTAENMKYTNPQRMVELFRKVTSVAQAEQLIKAGPVAIANHVYGGWLGNTAPNDGWLYRGRGYVQLTGKDNYTKAAKDIGVDIVSNPRLVSDDPKVAAKVATWFFKNSRQLQSIKTTGNFSEAARGLNGGKALPGMERRFSYYQQYLADISSGRLKAMEGIPGSDPSVAPVNTNAPDAPVAALPEDPLAKGTENRTAPPNLTQGGTPEQLAAASSSPQTLPQSTVPQPATPTSGGSSNPLLPAIPSSNAPQGAQAPSSANAPSILPQGVREANRAAREQVQAPTPIVEAKMSPEHAAVSAAQTSILQQMLDELKKQNRPSLPGVSMG